MNQKETPLFIEGIYDNLYAGFGPRLGSLLLDGLFLSPLTLLTLYINHLNINYYYFTLVPNLLIALWYHVYLPKVNGGTPGKLMAGISIVRIDGEPIGWREAILRHSVVFALTLLSLVMMISCLSVADESVYQNMSWLKQSEYLMSLSPVFFRIYTWVSNIWVYGELIVLLTNKRKRAVHDFIAGTVIVKTKYIPNIREAMNSSEPTGDDLLTNKGHW